MKATGIVRRIDDLGRVVIPKEIRRTMHIREGDPLEIYTDREGEVIFKKYSPIGELSAFASQYADTLHKTGGLSVIICDRDSVIACSGVPKKDFFEKRLSSELEAIMEARAFYSSAADNKKPTVADDDGNYYISSAMPILTEGDITGCVVSVLSNGETSPCAPDIEQKLITTAANFLGKQLEA